jgi:hypothetical protein
MVDRHPFTARRPDRAARGSRRPARRPPRSSFGLRTVIKQSVENVTPIPGPPAETGSRRPLSSGSATEAAIYSRSSSAYRCRQRCTAVPGENKSGLYRQCAGRRTSGNEAKHFRAGALSIRPVVLNPLWGFNRKLVDKKEVGSWVRSAGVGQTASSLFYSRASGLVQQPYRPTIRIGLVNAVLSTNPLFLATSNPGNRGDCKKSGGKSSRATQNVSTPSAVHLALRLNYWEVGR